jgi:hypothetical protein
MPAASRDGAGRAPVRPRLGSAPPGDGREGLLSANTMGQSEQLAPWRRPRWVAPRRPLDWVLI